MIIAGFSLLARVSGLVRTLVFSQTIGLAAGAVAAAAGVAVCIVVSADGKLLAAAVALAAATLTIVAFGVVAYAPDRGDLKTVAARMRQAVRSRA